MKRTVHKASEIAPEISPFTPKGEPVLSRLEQMDNPDDPRDPYRVLFTPDRSDAIRVLQFLDTMNGIGWTPHLRQLEGELRDALHDLMATDS